MIGLGLAQVTLRLKISQYFPYGSSACYSLCYVVATTAAGTSATEVNFVFIVHIRPRAELVRSKRNFIPSFAALPFTAAII